MAKVMVRNTMIKAIILNGGRGSAILPLVNHYPKILFPILNEPLIASTIRALVTHNITEIAIVSSPTQDPDKDLVTRSIRHLGDRVRLHYQIEFVPKGTAGALCDMQDFVGSSTVIVLQSNLFLKEADFTKLVASHRSCGAIATVALQRNGSVLNAESLFLDEKYEIKQYHIGSRSSNLRNNVKTSGIYIFEPEVLSHIPQNRYMDIREQLLPTLIKEKVTINSHDIGQSVIAITTISDYINLNKDLLYLKMTNSKAGITKGNKLGDVAIGNNVTVSPRANIIGPVIIGDNCVIKDFAQIIGPVVVGNNSTIGREVIVKDTIIWDNVRIRKKSRVEYSLIGSSEVVDENNYVFNVVYAESKKVLDPANISPNYSMDGNLQKLPDRVVITGMKNKFVKKEVYLACKAVTDKLIAGLSLVLFAPLMVLVALLIRLSSPGPVLFCQNRCSKNGKEFKMLKFRTMIIDADKLQDSLVSQNIVDGPMFKMEEDPRVTRLGKFLRKTSLDELPQLINVLRGEMSIVGPRPLRMEEMSFCPNWRDMRLLVTPGITGLWQVRKKDNETFGEWIQSDIEYVLNQSFLLDMKIILKTFRAAYQKKIFNTQESYESTVNLSRP